MSIVRGRRRCVTIFTFVKFGNISVDSNATAQPRYGTNYRGVYQLYIYIYTCILLLFGIFFFIIISRTLLCSSKSVCGTVRDCWNAFEIRNNINNITKRTHNCTAHTICSCIPSVVHTSINAIILGVNGII